jgi:hypothetical protein
MQGIEIGISVNAQDDCLAVQHEPLRPYLPRGLDDPRITVGPVVTAPCDEAHVITVALQAEAVAVVLDLVEPVRRVRNLGSPRRDAEIERGTHALEIGVV